MGNEAFMLCRSIRTARLAIARAGALLASQLQDCLYRGDVFGVRRAAQHDVGEDATEREASRRLRRGPDAALRRAVEGRALTPIAAAQQAKAHRCRERVLFSPGHL